MVDFFKLILGEDVVDVCSFEAYQIDFYHKYTLRFRRIVFLSKRECKVKRFTDIIDNLAKIKQFGKSCFYQNADSKKICEKKLILNKVSRKTQNVQDLYFVPKH